MYKTNRTLDGTKMRQTLLNLIATKLTKADSLIEGSAEFLELYAAIKPYTMTSRDRCYALYRALNYLLAKNVPGDFAECGVWRGGNTMLMALLLQRRGFTDRKIYLYDTFEGMSEPTAKDRKTNEHETALKKWHEKQNIGHNDWCYASLEEVTHNMTRTKYPSENIIYIKGKVEDTLKTTKPERLALLRLDTDWYESTKIELEVLYPQLSPAGVLIIDDYGAWEGARKAVDEYFLDSPILLNKIDDTGLIGVKAY
jgi:O-methyltransferase